MIHSRIIETVTGSKKDFKERCSRIFVNGWRLFWNFYGAGAIPSGGGTKFILDFISLRRL